MIGSILPLHLNENWRGLEFSRTRVLCICQVFRHVEVTLQTKKQMSKEISIFVTDSELDDSGAFKVEISNDSGTATAAFNLKVVSKYT